MAAGGAVRQVTTLFRLDGSSFEARMAGRNVQMGGSRNASLWVIEDVSEQRRAEMAVQQAKDRLELAQEAGKIGVFDIDLLTGQVLWSEKLVAMMGLAPGTQARTQRDWQDLLDRVSGIGPKTAEKLTAQGLTVNGRAYSPSPVVWKRFEPRPLKPMP